MLIEFLQSADRYHSRFSLSLSLFLGGGDCSVIERKVSDEMRTVTYM